MRILLFLSIFLYFLCTAAVAGALAVPWLGGAVPGLFFGKAAILLAIFAGTLLRARPGWLAPALLFAGAALQAVPLPTLCLLPLAGILLTVLSGFLAGHRGVRPWLLWALVPVLLAAGRVVVELLVPDWLVFYAYGLGLLLGLLVLCRLVYDVAVSRRLAVGSTVLLYTGALFIVVVPTLSPGLQFNANMALFISFFIVLAGAIASLFTYLFLKSFERLEHDLLQSCLYFVPLTAAPLYLVGTGLEGPLAGFPAGHGSLAAYALAMDVVVLGAFLLLLAARLAGRRFGPRNFVPLVAWKFLRSQRAVPTFGTRRNLALRGLVSGTGGGTSPLAAGLEIALIAGGVFALASLADYLIISRSWVMLVTTAAVCSAASWLAIRALGGAGPAGALLAVAALGMGGWGVWLAALSSTLGVSKIPRFIPPLLAALPLVMVGINYTVRLLLSFLRRRGRLSRDLDPRFAPRIITRIREGVGASVFASVVGVAIGVWALIVVLSVMGGFSGELEERIVRTKDHVRVKATGETRALGSPFELEGSIAGLDGVESASLYVEGEAMMSSSMNISSTVTVRGIPRTGPGGRFIEKNLVAGSMDFFRHPEDLVAYPGIIPFYRSELTPVSDWADLSPDLEETPALPDVGEEIESAEEVLPEVPGAQGLVMMPSIDGPEGEGVDKDPFPAPSTLYGGSGQQVLPPVIIGQELARSMGAGVGSRLTVISPDGDIGPMGVQPKARSFLVAAIFSTGMYEYDLKLAYMYLPHAQRFFNLGESIDHVDVRLADLETSGRVRDEILTLPAAGSVEVLTWQEMNRNLLSALKLERVVMFIVLGFIILIASFNIIASLIIIIRKRLSAIAILKTMGAAAGDITRIFFLLGSAAGLFGIASGVLMGLSSCGIISHLGLTLPREYYIRSLPVSVDGWQVVQIAFAALFMTALASLYPGRLASRVLVVEGLKDER